MRTESRSVVSVVVCVVRGCSGVKSSRIPVDMLSRAFTVACGSPASMYPMQHGAVSHAFGGVLFVELSALGTTAT